MLARFELDAERLAAELAAVEALPFNGSYGDFVCGELASAMLFNRTGDSADGMLEDYSGPGCLTASGRAMPYLIGLLQERFDLTTLRFARLIRLGRNSVLVPHCDYLELARRFSRIHVPLRTDERCYSAQESTVFRMRQGEVWLLDATKVHSAASFSPVRRIHLVLDFAEADDPGALLRAGAAGDGATAAAAPAAPASPAIPASHVVDRQPIAASERQALEGLSGVLAEDNVTDVLSILVKTCFQRDVAVGSVFGWLHEIAVAGGRPDLVSHVVGLEEYYVSHR